MSRSINITEGMRFGAGVDDVTEEVRGLPIEFDGISDNKGGQFADPKIRMIESQESLMESMNLSVNVSARYLLASADAKLAMAKEHSINQYSLFLLMSVEVKNPPRSMIRPRLTAEAQRIYKNDPEQFRQIYGDFFIDEIYSGGEFFGLFVFETFDEHSHTQLKGSLDGAIGGFFAGGSINASFQTTLDEAKSKSTMQIHAFMAGGAGLENPTNIEELKELYKGFNAKVLERPIDYKASIKDFRFLPLPEGPSWVEQTVRRDVIEQCGQRVLEGIRLRSDIGFVLRYPDQFEKTDLDALKATYKAIDAQLPKLANRARDCSQNIAQCSLEGIEPIITNLPKRLVNTGDPLQLKWREVLDHDSRAAGYFSAGGLKSPMTMEKYDYGPRNGLFRLFYDQNNNPIGGIFWHPTYGATVVYGSIFQKYNSLGLCNNIELGYPTSDELSESNGVDRISHFEHGSLLWEAKTGEVTLIKPINLDPNILRNRKPIEIPNGIIHPRF